MRRRACDCQCLSGCFLIYILYLVLRTERDTKRRSSDGIADCESTTAAESP